MLKVENLSYSFPEKDLYHKISFTIENGQHCALIGSCGTGKSTLLDIIRKPEDYLFDGKIELEQNCRIGYVSQFLQFDKTSEITVFDYIAAEFTQLQNEINDICKEMETSTEFDELLERYQQKLDAFTAIGGDDFESIINKKLGLANLDKYSDLGVHNLSGGEFKLVQVIKEMLTAPDLLIMDEPDVFLDFEHLNALKNLINEHKGCLLVITHNRYLLNHCFNKIIHLENRELQEFDGRYMDYRFSLLQGKIELQELAAADTEEIERNKEIIDRYRKDATFYTCASRGRALNARVSLLERLEARRIKGPFVDIQEPEIVLKADSVEEDATILKVDDFCASYDEVLLDHIGFEIKSTDKVALVGANGTGKTTLLHEIYKNNSSAISIADGIKMDFLSQLQGERLNESNSILTEFLNLGFKNQEEVLNVLSKYGISEEVLNQKIQDLSGGEKNLLQLAKISTQNANFLLLDEPSSHLDTYSQKALEKAIEEYNGAILMVSHDFYMIANCMDYVLMLEDKKIRKMSIRKFRKMIYGNHFDKNYLELEQKKKEVEIEIETALNNTKFEQAKMLSEKLEEIIKKL